jgi:hypothetical protein
VDTFDNFGPKKKEHSEFVHTLAGSLSNFAAPGKLVPYTQVCNIVDVVMRPDCMAVGN